MDLQLYRVDDYNYLVDFRNIGYYAASSGKDDPDDVRSIPLTSAEGDEPQSAVEPTAGAAKKGSTMEGGAGGQIGGVSGPFQFLEMACQLIAELANGG